jgi:putative DNA-invertase from lambdoid prophage Rac
MKALIYTRVSTVDQDCTRQVNDLLAYAARAGLEVVEIFRETASGAKNDRAERKKAIALARKREVNLILVTELSRWGRSTSDLLATLQDLAAWEVSLIALNGLQLDLGTPTGKLMATILAGVADYERELICDRVRSGLASARARGKKLGRPPGMSSRISRKANQAKEMLVAGEKKKVIAKELGISRVSLEKLLVVG